jgi:hypothetical protein
MIGLLSQSVDISLTNLVGISNAETRGSTPQKALIGPNCLGIEGFGGMENDWASGT